MLEKETKIIDIDADEIIAKLQNLGARKVYEGTLRSVHFDTADGKLKRGGMLLRLRTDGNACTLTFKMPEQADDGGVKIMREIETNVNDSNSMQEILAGLDYIVDEELTAVKERMSFELNKARIEIDNYKENYEFIPPFIEIEAGSKEKIVEIAQLLGYGEKDFKPWTFYHLKKYYAKNQA